MTEALPFQTQQPIFSKMGGISELCHMDSEERRKYFYSLNKYRTNLSVMENEHAEGVAEGLEKGLQQGLQQGRNERALEIAANLKALGFNIEQISEATGLSLDVIESLIP